MLMEVIDPIPTNEEPSAAPINEAPVTANVKLDFILTYTQALEMGMKNVLSIVGCVVLWILTIWVPYINIGTTIAIMTLPIELSKGGIISPLGIFDRKYRERMGDVFLYLGFMSSAIMTGTVLFIVPGIVLSIAWTLGIYLLLDKKLGPIQALMASYAATNGNKWMIFLVSLAFGVAIGILSYLFGLLGVVGTILNVLLVICAVTVSMAINASIYKQLKDNK